MSAVLGIDVSKNTLDACLLDDPGQAPGMIQVANTAAGFAQLIAWLAQQGAADAPVVLEATGRYWLEVTQALQAAGHAVSVVNPARIKAFRGTLLVRNKTDAQDAALIARFGQLHHPEPWTPPKAAQERLRALFRRRQTLLKMRQQERNRHQAGSSAAWVTADREAHIAWLSERLKAVEQELHQHLKLHPDLWAAFKLLQTIPGIGPHSAVALLAEAGDLSRFDHPGQLVAYVGVNPQQHQSGSSIHKPSHIAKKGNARLRCALYMAAVAAKQQAYFLPFVQRLEASGHCPLSIVIAVMRKLLHLAFGVLKSGRAFDPLYLEKQAAAA